MPEHKPVQGNCPDIMPRAGSRIAAVVGADEKVLICFESVCRAVVQLGSTVRTEYLARKDTEFSRCGRAAFVFADFLYRLKDMPVYNGRVGILKYPAVVFLPVKKGNRIEAEMVVQMVFIKVGSDDDLKAISLHFLCQLQSDLVRLFGCDFVRFKTLITVPGDISILFAVLLFR